MCQISQTLLEDLSGEKKQAAFLCMLLFRDFKQLFQAFNLKFPEQTPTRETIQMERISSRLPYKIWMKIFAFALLPKLQMKQWVLLDELPFENRHLESITQAFNWLLSNTPVFELLDSAAVKTPAVQEAEKKINQLKEQFHWQPHSLR